MGYDFDTTHERILESAKAHFMENGFRKASIRQICRDAGVTNGAFYAHFESKEYLFGKLAEPFLTGLQELLAEEKKRYAEVGAPEEVLEVLSQTFSSDETVIRYIYENADAFRLILTAGGGTEYEDFAEKILAFEKEGTLAFLEQCRPFVRNTGRMSENLIEQASAFIVNSVISCFLSGKTEEETLRETRLASEFCIAGLRQVWGI